MMSNRSRDYYRKMRRRAINRKKKIINSYREDNIPSVYGLDINSTIMMEKSYGSISPYWYVEHDGMLNKGKIHCSCGMCAFHGTTTQDTRKLKMLENQLDDFYSDDSTCENIGILTLRNKIRRKANGRYYPKGGIIGTKVPTDKKNNIDEFRETIKKRNGIRNVI